MPTLLTCPDSCGQEPLTRKRCPENWEADGENALLEESVAATHSAANAIDLCEYILPN
jgi:hypothetical protein